MSKSALTIRREREFDLQRFAAIICIIISLIGVALGFHLTLVKFKMAYTPCMSVYGGCQIGGLTCDPALDSTWSLLFGVPISLWGSAHYLVTALIAMILVVRRAAFGGLAGHILVMLAGFALLVSMVLGTYSALFLSSACPYCVSLYAVSVLLFCVALATRGSPGTRPVPLREALRQQLADLLDGIFVAALCFIFTMGIQSIVYHGLRNLVDAQTGCPEPQLPLPPATIKVGVDNPRAIIALFIDMSCSECRKEFKMLANAFSSNKFADPVQLWIYQTPRHACDSTAFPQGYSMNDDASGNNNACLAARAVECMEVLKKGQGFQLIGGLFTLQETPAEDGPLFTAERIGNKAVKLGMEIDPDDEHNPLFRCIDNDKTVLAHITDHQRFAEDSKFKVPTVVVYHAVDGAPDLTRKALFGDSRTPLEALIGYVAQQASSEVRP